MSVYIRNLKSDQIISSDRKVIEADQASDPKLSNIQKRVELDNPTVSWRKLSGERKFVMKRGLIYQQFTLRGKTTSQLVAPSSLTDKVMTLAHEPHGRSFRHSKDN